MHSPDKLFNSQHLIMRVCVLPSSLREWAEARPGAGEAVSHGRHHSQGAAGVVFFSRAQDTRAGHRSRDQAGLLLHKTPPR
jgi:hypothetical protein